MTGNDKQKEYITYREARLDDIPALYRIRMSVKENVLSSPDLVPLQDYEEFLSRRGKGWVAEVDNSIAGFAIADMVDHNVWALFLDPLQERKGIGRELHDRMLNWYFDQSTVAIWLSTSPGTRAESFYRNAGWTQTGFQKNGEIRFEMTAADWASKKR